MFKFSEVTRRYLLSADWHEGRNVDVSELKNALLNDNYTVFDSVKSFLSEFGYLRIFFHLVNGALDSFHFNAKIATEEVDVLWAQQDYYNRLNTKQLCVIGQAYTNHMTLMMDIDGKVYGGFDEVLILISNSGKEAICSNQKFRQIP